MQSPLVFCAIAASLLFNHALGAPPLSTLTGPSSHIQNVANLTASSTFPPRSQLPDPHHDVFMYKVPSTDITIKFRAWYQHSRPAAEAMRVLGQAARSCDHPTTAMQPGIMHMWESGSTVLQVTPHQADADSNYLNWLLWDETLPGLVGWVRSYPGLHVGFEIYEMVGRGVEDYIAEGALTMYVMQDEEGRQTGGVSEE